MSYLTLHSYGLPENVFAKRLDTVDAGHVGIHVRGAIANRGIASIIGPRGAGKSSAVAEAMPKDARIVAPLTADRERMRIGAIEDSICYDLSKEPPRRSAEARTRQVRRILGEAAQTGPVVLLIEEGHRLHHQTLRALKTLHELKWAGRGPLLTILLIGQKDPLALPSLEEVAKRCKSVKLAGLSEPEAISYIRGTVGRVWSEDAISALAAEHAARNFLDLQEALIGAMDQALSEGRRTVELTDVYHAIGGGLRQMAERLGVSQADIAKATGKDKSTISRVLSGERDDPTTKARIREMLDAKSREAGVPVGGLSKPDLARGAA